MPIVPREYQNWAHTALVDHVHKYPKNNPLIILPTGTGKSLQIGMFMWDMLSRYPSTRMMMITHVKELIEGNYRALLSLWPAAPAGIYSAGLGRKDVFGQLTFAGIQSVVKRAGRFGHIDFILIDEAHLVGNSDSASYIKFIKALKTKNPNLVVIGFTATPFRMGLGMLTDGKIFDHIAFDGSDGEAFIWFIENGYLIRPVPKDPGFQLDSDDIGIVGADFHSGQASRALAEQDILERAVDLTIKLGTEQDRQSWLTFAQSIDDAELVADMFRYKGHDVEAVHSKRDDRDEVIKDFKSGKLRGIVNRDILTTGFDHPSIDLISMLRLTRSPGLWVQMLGRGTRPVYVPGHDLLTKEGRLASIAASHKQTCLVLDFVGNTERLGPINYPSIPKRRGPGGGEAPVRICPECDTYLHPSVNPCPECGHIFPPPERLRENASTENLVENRAVIDLNLPLPEPIEEVVYGVNRMVCSHHEGRPGKKDTLRADYFCGMRMFSAWICFEHDKGSFPKRKADEWWKMHGGKYNLTPDEISDAVDLAYELNKPKFIKVRMNPKFPEIIAYDFRGTAFNLPPEAGGPPLQEPPPDPFEEEKARHFAEAQKYIQDSYDDDLPF